MIGVVCDRCGRVLSFGERFVSLPVVERGCRPGSVVEGHPELDRPARAGEFEVSRVTICLPCMLGRRNGKRGHK